MGALCEYILARQEFQESLLWLLPLVELFQKEKHKLAVRDTFCMISPLIFVVRKSSWVFWAALVALSIVLPSTVHWRAIDARFTRGQNFWFFKKNKFSSIFSKNRSKKFLKHFFENLSCAFFIGMILYLKRAFPGMSEVRNNFYNSPGNCNMLQKSEILPTTRSPVWRSNNASMTRQ